MGKKEKHQYLFYIESAFSHQKRNSYRNKVLFLKLLLLFVNMKGLDQSSKFTKKL